eukprot:gnl/TRDRNA2_/TRDRNA2_168148_c0_seq3.p1 gnl/TRDRNA2_/TRDRNA2_168148_c0~~gnl/TRDRNA2_/TRDRNA2_168148_c0_seq3.p1  ORF type:complete len:202 (+),score=76.19 gnl/TRDRNA2_/TRDRNA2_168148_c0_seq3:82-606(+)
MGAFSLIVLCFGMSAAALEDACIADAHGHCISQTPDETRGSQLLQVNRIGVAKAAAASDSSMEAEAEASSNLKERAGKLVTSIEDKIAQIMEQVDNIEEKMGEGQSKDLEEVKQSLLELQDQKDDLLEELDDHDGHEEDEEDEEDGDAEELAEGDDDDDEDVGEPAEPPPMPEQ